MSIHVMSWVLRESDAQLGDRLVLLVLADHAREDGTSAWPSLETIAHQSRLSERQARRCLRNLEEAGEIVETGKSRKGTHIYSFPKYIARGDNMSAPGGTSTTSGGDMMTPDPSLEQPSEALAAAPRARPRNELWDALEHIFGPASTRQAQQVRGKVVSGLALAGATPAEINARARRWRLHFEGATMTEIALEKHWDTLPRRPLK